MAQRKKTRTLWQGIKYYTVETFIAVCTLFCIGIVWTFSGMFNIAVWKFLMGIIAGIVIMMIYGKRINFLNGKN